MEPVTAATVKIWGDIAGYVAWEAGSPCAPYEIEKLMELVQDVLTEPTGLDVRIDETIADKEKAEALSAILRVGASAGGAVPKAIVAVKGDGHVISGQAGVRNEVRRYIGSLHLAS